MIGKEKRRQKEREKEREGSRDRKKKSIIDVWVIIYILSLGCDLSHRNFVHGLVLFRF